MRTIRDRIRHVIFFEIIGLMLVIPLGAAIFHHSMGDIGIIGVVSAVVATAWNYLFNLGFDRLMQWRLGTTLKTTPLRVVHAIAFEAGLLVVLLPFIAWQLDLTLLDALVMDMSIAFFYVIYAFLFNLAYDRVFPLPEWQDQTA